MTAAKRPGSSVVERFLGKEEVAGSIPALGSIDLTDRARPLGSAHRFGDPPVGGRGAERPQMSRPFLLGADLTADFTAQKRPPVAPPPK